MKFVKSDVGLVLLSMIVAFAVIFGVWGLTPWAAVGFFVDHTWLKIPYYLRIPMGHGIVTAVAMDAAQSLHSKGYTGTLFSVLVSQIANVYRNLFISAITISIVMVELPGDAPAPESSYQIVVAFLGSVLVLYEMMITMLRSAYAARH